METWATEDSRYILIDFFENITDLKRPELQKNLDQTSKQS